MARKRILAGVLAGVLWTVVAVAEEPPGMRPPQDAQGGGTFATMRTVAYFPFKGVVCVVGALASFPVYWLSGMDPQVKNDTEAMRAKYCSRDYLFSSEWPR